MSYQTKIVKIVFILTLLVVLTSGLLVTAAKDTKYKTFTSEEFGFSIRYPQSWEKEYRDEEDKPHFYQGTYLRVSTTEDPSAIVTVIVSKLAQPTSLNELKRYLELNAQLFPQNGSIKEIYIGEFAGLGAVIANYTNTSIGKKMVTGEDGTEEIKWERSKWKGQMIRATHNGYFYRITTSAPQEEYEGINEKYLSKILNSFEFTK